VLHQAGRRTDGQCGGHEGARRHALRRARPPIRHRLPPGGCRCAACHALARRSRWTACAGVCSCSIRSSRPPCWPRSGSHRHVGLHIEHAQGLLHGFAEHRRCHLAAVKLARAGLVEHHPDDDAGCVDRCHADEPAAVLAVAVAAIALTDLLVRGARLSAHRVAHGLRLGCGAARTRSHLQHLANFSGSLARKHIHAHGGLRRFEQCGGNEFAVVGEHGVGARHLEERGRQTVPVGGSGLLDRTPFGVRAQPPGHHTGKLHLGLVAKTGLRKVSHMSRAGICMAILAVPTLLET